MAGYSVKAPYLDKFCVYKKIQSSVCVMYGSTSGGTLMHDMFLLALSGRMPLGACLCSYPGMFAFLGLGTAYLHGQVSSHMEIKHG